MPNSVKDETADRNKFLFYAQPQIAVATDANAKRKFSGVAYTGNIIPKHWFWGNVIFDLSTMTIPDRLPALIDHERGQRAGFVESHSVSEQEGFRVSGVLLSNESGQTVARDSDDGFPWQMSVHIEPGSVEELKSGGSVVINGREVRGPAAIFRNSRIVEVSFTATGQDGDTSAVAMSRGGFSKATSDKDSNSMTPEEIAAMQAENAKLKVDKAAAETARDAATDELKKFSSDRRTADIKQLFSDLKKDYKDDDKDVKMFSGLPQDAFDSMAQMLRSQFSSNPMAQAQGGMGASGNLFGHQAMGGQAGTNAGTQAPANTDDALMADAQRRAEQFSNQRRH